MGQTSSIKDHFAAPDFAALLHAQLEDARQTWGLKYVALAELSLGPLPLSPTWRATTGTGPFDEPPARDLFEEHSDDEPRASSVAMTYGPDSDVLVTALRVAPRLASHADAVLLLAPASVIPTDTFLQLLEVLERALSRQRSSELAAILAAAAEQAADPLELSDPQGRLFYVNSAWERFTGYERAEALGRTAGAIFRDPIESLHDPAFYQYAMAELHAGRSWMGAISGNVKGGRRVFGEANVAPFEAPSAGLRGHVAVRRDMVHRTERDHALVAAHREFRAVLSAIADGVCVLRDERIYFTNATFLAIVGLSEEELVGRSFVDLVHEEDRAAYSEAGEARVARVRVSRAGSSPRFVEISSAGRVSFEGWPATILLARDTTDYQVAREELARAEKLSALGSLAAGVAHEINNPLAYVALNLELLREHGASALAEPEREALEEALEGVARIRNIASELHTFSGKDEPGEPVAVDVSRALTSALNMAQNEIRHRAALVREMEPGLFALGREGQLVQVFVNVLINAAQAIPKSSAREPTIRVASRLLADGEVEVSVTDTGIGIPESALPQLFDPFSTTKLRGDGAGLGLAICKRILDDLGGHIAIQSELGQGTTVTITLPEAVPAALASTPPQPSYRRIVTRALRILVVEDERPIARALERMLASHDVTLAHDGARALALLRASKRFDVVLCDLMMPGMTGADLYRQAVEEAPELRARFVFMTGGAVTPDTKEFIDASVGQVLWKPFTPGAVWDCIQRVAGRAEEQRSARAALGGPSTK
ncbi:MAG: PAS domain S-box protein [Myxococcales bacterium]|nr:MAG: PAS domain S-box protein [Myxococcales bacterium]